MPPLQHLSMKRSIIYQLFNNHIIQHVTASIATRKLIINLGRRVNLVSFNMQVSSF